MLAKASRCPYSKSALSGTGRVGENKSHLIFSEASDLTMLIIGASEKAGATPVINKKLEGILETLFLSLGSSLGFFNMSTI